MARITNQGKALIAQKQVAKEPLIIDRFLWAHIDGLDHTKPINPDEPIPKSDQIKHDAEPTQSAYVSPDIVVYSSTLGSTIGTWQYNWIGLVSAEDVLIACNYLPVQTKTNSDKNNIGNTVNKNFALQYKDIQDTTGITIKADTWQIDYTASFDNIDERERLSNFDLYGRQTFVNDGFQVVKSGSDYHVKAGWGYVAGLRIALDTIGVLPDVGALPKNVFVDVVLNGGIAGKTADFKFIASADEKQDYEDSAGQQHFLEKIAVISSAGVEDKRKTLDLKARETILERLQRQVENHKHAAKKDITGLGSAAFKAVGIKYGDVALIGNTDISNATGSAVIIRSGLTAHGYYYVFSNGLCLQMIPNYVLARNGDPLEGKVLIPFPVVFANSPYSVSGSFGGSSSTSQLMNAYNLSLESFYTNELTAVYKWFGGGQVIRTFPIITGVVDISKIKNKKTYFKNGYFYLYAVKNAIEVPENHWVLKYGCLKCREYLSHENGKFIVKKRKIKKEEYFCSERLYRDTELSITDRYLVDDFPITAKQKKSIIEYRKKLRDLPDAATFENAYNYSAWRPFWPEGVPRPVQ